MYELEAIDRTFLSIAFSFFFQSLFLLHISVLHNN